MSSSHDGTTAVEPPPPIPVDVLLEILARVDVATVVRCAATCKTVRRAILGDPTMGRRVQANGGLLLGVSYAILEHETIKNYGDTKVSFVGQAPRQNHIVGFDAGRKLQSSKPVASRGGLVVLLDPSWLYVWNALTRRMQRVRLPTDGGYPSYALLTVALLLTAGGDAGRSSFQLLVVRRSRPCRPSGPSPLLRTQIYSNDDGRWGPVTKITDIPPELKLICWNPYPPSRRPEALVLGGGAGTAVHWLHINDGSGRCIVRLDIDEAKVTLMAVPPDCVHWPLDGGELQLAASTDGKLSLVVAELCVISMWKLSDGGPAARWTRQVVISRDATARVPTAGRYKNHRDLFLGFGELSGTVVLLMHHVGIVRINLTTKEALVLQGSDDDLKN